MGFSPRIGIFLLILATPLAPLLAQDFRSLVRVHIPGYSPSSIPFQIAEEQGFYQEEWLNVRTLRMKTGAGIQAMLAGDIDVRQITGPTVLAAILQGAPLKVVMVFNDRPTYRLYVRKEIKSFADLKGAKIGSSTPGSTSDRLLKIVLEKNKVRWQKEITIIYIGTTDVVLKALKSGAIDAAVLTPPADFLASEAGFHELFSFESEVGALQGGVSTTESFLTNKTETAVRFLRATLKGLKYFKNNREGPIRIMMKSMGVSKEIAGRIYDGNSPAFVSNGLISDEFQEKVLDFELKAIGTDKKVQREKVFDFSVMKSLATN
jgi:NitT/TauT family transport system substrate-binding protein